MTTSVKYIGAVEPYYETAITGKQNGWRKGQGGDVPDGDATLLVASGLFVLNRSPLTDVAAESAQAAFDADPSAAFKSGPLGPVADLVALTSTYPAASNIGKTALVGSAAPYVLYASTGVGWAVVSISATAPGKVTGLTLGIPSATTQPLLWTAPNNGGSSITDYVIQRSPAGAGTWTTFADGTSTAASATVTGLSSSTNYDYRVAAVNALGQGSYSDIVTGATPSPSSWEVPGAFTNTGLADDGTNFLIGDYSGNRIVKTTYDGAFVSAITPASSPVGSIQGVAWDAGRSNIWVGHYDAANGTLRRYATDGTLLQTISLGIEGPNHIAYDAANDRLLVAFDYLGQVKEYACTTGTLLSTVTVDASLGVAAAGGIDGITMDPVDPANYFWVSAEPTFQTIAKINRATGAIVTSFRCPVSPEGIVWHAGAIYICCDAEYHKSINFGNRVYRLDADGFFPQGFGFKAKIVTVDLRTTTGVQIVNGVGFRPQLAIVLGSPSVAAAAGGAMCLGASDDQNRTWGIDTIWNDADATAPIMANQIQTARTISRTNAAGTSVVQAYISDYHFDGFRLSVTANTGALAHRVSILCLAGDTLRAKVGTFNLNTVTGVQAVAGMGWQPTGALFATSKRATANGASTATASRFAVGAMSSAAQWAYDAEAGLSVPQAVYGAAVNDAAIVMASSSSVIEAKAAFSSFDADGFSINLSTAPATSFITGYVALKGVNLKVGAFDARTTNGAQAITGAGFSPSAVLFGGADTTALGAQAQTRPMLGVATATAQAATSMSATDAANPTVAGRISTESAAITHATGTGTTSAQAAFTSMDADGFTVTWGTTDGAARKEFYLALG